MTAERLREAASRLRNAAGVGDTNQFPGDWTTIGVFHDDWGTTFDVECESAKGLVAEGLDEDVADFVALMHPAVALAQADWLDDYANTLDVYGDVDRTRDNTPALRLADAILREA